jgi:FtsP/CotA-like multicopper oxidase with cupredoxin domain
MTSVRPTRAIVAFATVTLALACTAPPPPPDARTALDLPLAATNDLRTPAGTMRGDTLVVELDVVQVAWTPRANDGPRVPTRILMERGGTPSVPGPLIRLAAGTPLRLSVRNSTNEFVELGSALDSGTVFGVQSIGLAPGATHESRWTPSAPVSSAYAISGENGLPGASAGAIVVDPAGAAPHPDERILLLSAWGSRAEPTSLDPNFSWKLVVNGRSWPYTERFDFTVGDTVRWRVINAGTEWHPMHLHGFYFRVTSAGDLRADTLYDAATRPEVVTHALAPNGAMTLEWTPTTPGNWLFHCHLLRHSGETQRFAADAAHDAHDSQSPDAGMAMDDGMAGMITGITVHPPAGFVASEPVPRRHLDLWTSATAHAYGSAPKLGFALQLGNTPPRADSAPALSSLLVLTQHEPVEIAVHNRLDTPLALHWHGLELESTYDGVGHWSGMPGMPRPPIPAGDSLAVHLTPPRAGTFIYHTHGEEGFQLSQGLYGPLIVLPPGETYDPTRDRVYVLGQGGAVRDADPAVNGLREPPPERFEAGNTYRLRFIQIGADEAKVVSLLRDGEPVTWRTLAKDGAELPPAMQVERAASFRADVGETMDFAWTPASDGVYQLVVRTLNYPIAFDRGPMQTIAFAVGDVSAAAIADAHAGFDGVMSLDTVNRLMDAGALVVVLLLLAGVSWLLLRLARRFRRARMSPT